MPEKYGINPVWILLVAAIAVASTIFIGHKMLQTRVEAAQGALQRTNARVSELEDHAARLSFEREEAMGTY